MIFPCSSFPQTQMQTYRWLLRFKFLRPSEDEKHLVRFQSETTVFKSPPPLHIMDGAWKTIGLSAWQSIVAVGTHGQFDHNCGSKYWMWNLFSYCQLERLRTYQKTVIVISYYSDDDDEIAKYALKFYGNILSVNLTRISLLQVTEWLCGYSDIKQEKRCTCSSAPSVKLRGISSVQ